MFDFFRFSWAKAQPTFDCVQQQARFQAGIVNLLAFIGIIKDFSAVKRELFA